MVDGTGGIIDRNRVNMVKPVSESVSIPRYSSPLPNEMLAEETDGELHRPVV